MHATATTPVRTAKEEAIKRLRGWIKPGDTVYTILRHVSRSGMQRVIQVVTLNVKDGKVETGHVGWNVATALGLRYDRDREGVVMNGCGMDMGFDLVSHIGQLLWSHGDGVYISGRNGSTQPETDGGYLLKHRWL